MTRAPFPWTDRERAAWAPPPRLSPSQWAERYRRLTRRQSARPGPWRNANAPHLIGIMDLCARRGIEEINIIKAAQVGCSEAVRNVLGYWAHTDPDPVLLVLPDEKSGRKIVRKRIVPLIEDTPVLRGLRTSQSHDVQLSQIHLANGFQMNLGWSGSPSTLASDPIRRVINDEVDKFASWSGRETDPVNLAYLRTQTYEHNRLIINISTPTTRDGMIFRLWEQSPVKLCLFAPCPHCGRFQRLRFDQLRFGDMLEGESKEARAERIVAGKLAWYECEHCQGEIRDGHKPRMLSRGVWSIEDQEPDAHSPMLPEVLPSRRIGVHGGTALHSLWVEFSEVAAEFVRSVGDPQRMMNFRNGWLGEVFEDRVVSSPITLFHQKAQRAGAIVASGGPPRGMVPTWGGCILMTVDTQKDHFYYVVRAWGHGWRSKRIDHGRAETFEELQRILYAQWPIEKSELVMHISYLLIDSGGGTAGLQDGSRTDQVYRFAQTDPTRIILSKGASRPQHAPIKVSQVQYDPPGGRTPYIIHLRLIDTGYFKDVLANRVKIEEGEPGSWELDERDDGEYARQMVSEHKIAQRLRAGGIVQRWVTVTQGAANHYFDCEVMQSAAAEIAHVGLVPSQEVLIQERDAYAHPKPRRTQSRSWGMNMDNYDPGWLRRNW